MTASKATSGEPGLRPFPKHELLPRVRAQDRVMDILTYLRCANDHPNSVTLQNRDLRVGTACTTCGAPLQANPPRERFPARRF